MFGVYFVTNSLTIPQDMETYLNLNCSLLLSVDLPRNCWSENTRWTDYKLRVCDSCSQGARFCPIGSSVTVAETDKSILELHLTEIEVYGRLVKQCKTTINEYEECRSNN